MADRSFTTFAVWAVVALLGAFAVVRFARGGDRSASPVRIDRGPGSGATADRADGDRSSARQAFVHVAGAVRRPGLVRVPAGSRVASAVQRAGGPTARAELTLVNLAAPVEDGQQVVVPERGTGGALAPGAASAGSAADIGVPPGVKLSLGAATVDQLDELDGIGPTLAERIVEYRTKSGGIRSLEELKEVEGIGEKRFESLREAVQP
jgi:competence protein ComEA